jgi:hypothetical protein
MDTSSDIEVKQSMDNVSKALKEMCSQLADETSASLPNIDPDEIESIIEDVVTNKLNTAEKDNDAIDFDAVDAFDIWLSVWEQLSKKLPSSDEFESGTFSFDDIGLMFKYRSGQFRLHQRRLARGQSSSIGGRFFRDTEDSLIWIDPLPFTKFRYKPGISREPLKITKQGLQLIVVPEGGGSEISVICGENWSRDSSKSCLSFLSRLYDCVNVIAIEYKFDVFGVARRFNLKESFRLKLKPHLSPHGVFGRGFRDDCWLGLDFIGGTVSYRHRDQSFHVHIPLVISKVLHGQPQQQGIVPQQHSDPTPQLRLWKTREQFTQILDQAQISVTKAEKDLKETDDKKVYQQGHDKVVAHHRRILKKAHLSVNTIINNCRNKCDCMTSSSDTASAPVAAIASSDTASTPVATTCSTRHTCHLHHQLPEIVDMSTLRGGVDVPEQFLNIKVPTCRFTGQPLLRISRPVDLRQKLNNAMQRCRDKHFLTKYGKWGLSGDPNFSDFYTLYVANNGITLSVAENWAQIRLLYVLEKQDLWKSEMANLENAAMKKRCRNVSNQDQTIDWFKEQYEEIKIELLQTSKRYSHLQNKLDESRDELDQDREELHRFTINIMSAFDILVLPWLDVQSLVENKGVRSLSKANKRKGLVLGHGDFRQKLIRHRAEPSVEHHHILWVTEQYTSKLCGNCWRYCGYLGGSRVYKCPNVKCRVHLDRDSNAARNIWIWGFLRVLNAIEKEDREINALLSQLNAADNTDLNAAKSKTRFTLSLEFWSRFVLKKASASI